MALLSNCCDWRFGDGCIPKKRYVCVKEEMSRDTELMLETGGSGVHGLANGISDRGL